MQSCDLAHRASRRSRQSRLAAFPRESGSAPGTRGQIHKLGRRGLSTEEPKKQAQIARLMSDLRSAKLELLSAQSAAERLRFQYSVQDIVVFGERQTLKGAIAAADAICRFFASVEAELKVVEQLPNAEE
jgi:hypothetical protein